jgi:hypothetical protein
VQRDIRINTDGSGFNFPGMKIVPVIAMAAILWILGQASLSESSVGYDTRAGLRLAAVVLVIGSILYFARRLITRSERVGA